MLVSFTGCQHDIQFAATNLGDRLYVSQLTEQDKLTLRVRWLVTTLP